ncbi:MAG: 4-hydroxybenzoate octaprenyltransferase [Nitrospirales bacterium]|nr:4-hydroxybenzoate octaprenyltransferase [Nitrospirales bacterium]
MADLSSSAAPPPSMYPSLKALTSLVRLSNQTGTLLLLFPTLWALVLASRGQPSLELLIIFTVGSFLMRSAGVILNDLADRSFDRQVRRTQQRPLAKGILTPTQAGIFLFCIVSLATTLLWFLNPLTRWLGPVALLLAATYPFCKRFLQIPQIILGVAFGWGGVMAWTAVANHITPSTWLLFFATVSWAVVYDTIYAIQDIEDDRRIGVKSAAIFFGEFLWLGVGLAACVMLSCLSLIGFQLNLGMGYFLCLGISAILMMYQVIRLRTVVLPSDAFRMFQQHSWLGAIILLGILLGFIF